MRRNAKKGGLLHVHEFLGVNPALTRLKRRLIGRDFTIDCVTTCHMQTSVNCAPFSCLAAQKVDYAQVNARKLPDDVTQRMGVEPLWLPSSHRWLYTDAVSFKC